MRLKYVENGYEILEACQQMITIRTASHEDLWKTLPDHENLHMELGTGMGDFLLGMANQYRDRFFIGFERDTKVLVRAARKSEENENDNYRFIHMDAGKALPHFPDKQIQGIYLNFSDPWPKIRHAKRRLTHFTFLREYQRLLSSSGVLEMKTDNLNLFEYSLDQFHKEGWTILREERNLHATDLAESNVETEYERKFRAKGQPIYFLRACPK